MLVAGGASVIRDGTSGHDGVTIVKTGDSLFGVALLLTLIVIISLVIQKIYIIKILAERGFDPRTSGLWAQHASTAPLC